ncbi:protein of unknown function (plasmid) [Magnetospirillum sp. XM-1]|nr:protein of unknown function [Magnetospirillum sp. XM-1]
MGARAVQATRDLGLRVRQSFLMESGKDTQRKMYRIRTGKHRLPHQVVWPMQQFLGHPLDLWRTIGHAADQIQRSSRILSDERAHQPIAVLCESFEAFDWSVRRLRLRSPLFEGEAVVEDGHWHPKRGQGNKRCPPEDGRGEIAGHAMNLPGSPGRSGGWSAPQACVPGGPTGRPARWAWPTPGSAW